MQKIALIKEVVHFPNEYLHLWYLLSVLLVMPGFASYIARPATFPGSLHTFLYDLFQFFIDNLEDRMDKNLEYY